MALTYFSKQSGPWSSAGTWQTGPVNATQPTGDAAQAPQSGGGDKIIIRGGYTVEYDVVGVFGDGAFYATNDALLESATDAAILASAGIILSAGNLKAHRTISTSLTSHGNIFINWGPNKPTLDWGSSTDPISAAGVTSEIVLGLPSDTTALKYFINNKAGAGADNGLQNSSFFMLRMLQIGKRMIF
jgi:hypothetical protein